MKVIHCGDIRDRWKDLYVSLDDYEAIQYLTGEDYQQQLFNLCEGGFKLDSIKHEVVEDF